jgi:hypothetical protein
VTKIVERDIEQIVGTFRRYGVHYARAISSEETVYILHSQRCKDSGIDLRDCQYSLALDHGIDRRCWAEYLDVPVPVVALDGQLLPRAEVA